MFHGLLTSLEFTSINALTVDFKPIFALITMCNIIKPGIKLLFRIAFWDAAITCMVDLHFMIC